MNEKVGFRPMRRFKQQLSMQECEAILKEAYRGFLSVNGDDGYPYTIPVNFIYLNNHIYLHSATSGYKIDCINRSSKVCFTTINNPIKEENDWWYHVSSVICFGQIRVVEEEDVRMKILRQFGAKYFPEDYDINNELMQNGPHTAVLDLSIDHITGKRVKEN